MESTQLLAQKLDAERAFRVDRGDKLIAARHENGKAWSMVNALKAENAQLKADLHRATVIACVLAAALVACAVPVLMGLIERH